MSSLGKPIENTYNDFIAYLSSKGFRYVNYGSFRKVYVRKNVVIKVPLNTDGLLDNRVEARAYKLYKNSPTQNGIYLAACRLLPNGALMMVRCDLGYSTNRPEWVQKIDAAQAGRRKGRWVAYDFGMNLIERFDWENEWKSKSNFFYSKDWRSRFPDIDSEFKKRKRAEKVKVMNKEEFQKSVSEQCSALREQASHLTKLVDALQMIQRSDVSFGTIDETKKAIENVKAAEIKANLDKTFKTLKARANQRLKDM